MVVGSSRRDALKIIHEAALEDWKVSTTDTPSIAISTSIGQVVFQFSSTLEAVHITTPHESKHLLGSCEVAQRLKRYAERSLEILHARTESKCISFVDDVLNGRTALSTCASSYECIARHIQHHDGGYDFRETRRGSLTTPFGNLSLEFESREVLIGGEVGRQMELARATAMCEMQLRASTYQSSYSSPFQQIPIPAPSEPFVSYGPLYAVDSATSSFKNPKLDAIRNLFGLKEYSRRISLRGEKIQAALAWARSQQQK